MPANSLSTRPQVLIFLGRFSIFKKPNPVAEDSSHLFKEIYLEADLSTPISIFQGWTKQTMPSTAVSIAVFIGKPDIPSRRHAVIHIIYPDGTQDVVHAQGGPGYFRYSREIGYDPRFSLNLAAYHPVTTVSETVRKDSILDPCARTPISREMDWNCHNWIGEALSELVKDGLVTPEERSNALDKMIKTVLEAVDEPL